MRVRANLLSLLTLLCMASTRAELTIYLSYDSDFAATGQVCDAAGAGEWDTTHCCSNVGGSRRRYVGIKCIRDQLVRSMQGCAPNIDQAPGGAPFGTMLPEQPNAEAYLVYGVTDQFQVPATGAYRFRIVSNYSMLVLVGGKDLASPFEAGMKWNPGGTIGTLVEGDPNRADYYTTEVELTEGITTFEFLYASSEDYGQSRCRLLWTTPGSSTETVVPPSAFRGVCSFTGVEAPAPSRPATAPLISVAGHGIRVDNTSGAPATVRVLSVDGRSVVSRTVGGGARNVSINLGDKLSDGVYLVRIDRIGLSGTASRFILKR